MTRPFRIRQQPTSEILRYLCSIPDSHGAETMRTRQGTRDRLDEIDRRIPVTAAQPVWCRRCNEAIDAGQAFEIDRVGDERHWYHAGCWRRAERTVKDSAADGTIMDGVWAVECRGGCGAVVHPNSDCAAQRDFYCAECWGRETVKT